MSNVGQAALTIVGTGIGAFFGNPQLGYFLGSLAGQALFPTQLPDAQGPRLNDLAVQSSAIGAPVPLLYGTYAIAGNIIWSSGLLETVTTEEVGGKGGPTQDVTTYSYRASFAIGLCEGVMGGFLRIWADARVIYDRRPQQEGETDEAFAARIAASDATEALLTFYTGDEVQEADPVIEGYEGAGMVPAYRGLCYLVFEDLQLADYGNRIPNIRVELYSTGAQECETVTEYSNEVLFPWLDADDPVNPRNDHEFIIHATGAGVGDGEPGVYETEAAALAAAEAIRGRSVAEYAGYRTLIGNNYGRSLNRFGGRTVTDDDSILVMKHYAFLAFDTQRVSTPTFGSALVAAFDGGGFRVHMDGFFTGGGTWGNAGCAVYERRPYSGRGGPPPSGYDIQIVVEVGRYNTVMVRDCVIRVERIPRAPDDPCDPRGSTAYPYAGASGYCISTTGELVPAGAWERVTGTWNVLQKYTTTQSNRRGVVRTYPRSPARPQGDPDFNSQPFWDAAYAAAVQNGEMEAGLVYGVDYPVSQNYGYRRTYQRCTATSDPIPLSVIVQDLCARAGLTAVDVSELTKEVRGYVVSRVMNARQAIEPLRSFGYFDACESGELVKFPVRGRAPIATLTAADLAAHEFGSARPPAVSVTRKQDVELPRELRLHYANPDREYEPGEQKARRLTTGATNPVDVELVISMTDEEAAQCAEVLLYDAWVARNTYSIALDHSWLAVEPADVFLLPVDGQLERARVTANDHALVNLLRLELVRDDDGTYTSYAAGAPGAVIPPGIVLYGPTELVLLDLPPLRDADNDAGYYAAVRPRINGSTWRGAVIFRSSDSGASYAQVGAATQATAMGEVVAALPDGPTTVIDEGNTLLVSLQSGALESRTFEALLNGANAAAIGAHGRWEVIQFRDVETVGDYVQLSGLLRGRRGTEHNIGTSEAGDRFVLLSSGSLVRIPLESSAIGAARALVAVSIGMSFDATDAQDFTGAGQALECFSPVNVTASREADGDIVIEWTRRDRLSQELRDGAEIPMSEATESYSIDVVVDSAVVRTLTSSTTEVTYTTAQQAEDFGSPSPGAYTFRVYQLSATVGRGTPGEVTIDPPPQPEEFEPDTGGFADNRILLPLIWNVDDVEGLVGVTVEGAGYTLTDSGWLANGLDARLRIDSAGSPGLPSWLTSASGPLTLRATVTPRRGRVDQAEVLVSVCTDAASREAKLELVLLQDASPDAAFQCVNVVAQCYTGSTQQQRLARATWQFRFPWPEYSSGGFSARPNAITVEDSGSLLLAGHFESSFSRAWRVSATTGEVLGAFDLDATHTDVGSLATRSSNGDVWLADTATRDCMRLDVAASLASGEEVALATVDFSALQSNSAIAWADVDGTEYFLVAEFGTAGTNYIYVFAASVMTDGAAPAVADRVKRLVGPLRMEGIAYSDGLLYVACSTTPSGGLGYVLDIETFIASGADGASYTTVLEESFEVASQQAQDLAFDDLGDLWAVTAGYSTVGDDNAWLAVWSTPAINEPALNNYTLEYDGAGTVTIKVNDRLFAEKSWTPTPTPAVVMIGGDPIDSSSGTANRYAAGQVRNVVLQDEPIAYSDPFDASVVLSGQIATAQDLPVVNGDAEDGATGWTNETGSLGTRTEDPDPRTGARYFAGGTSALVVARQRFELAEVVDLTEAEIDAGSCWAVIEYFTAGFTSQDDSATVGFRFLDAGAVEISTTYQATAVPTVRMFWYFRAFGLAVPPGTRYVDVLMRFVRVDGTNNDGYIDDLTAKIYSRGEL